MNLQSSGAEAPAAVKSDGVSSPVGILGAAGVLGSNAQLSSLDPTALDSPLKALSQKQGSAAQKVADLSAAFGKVADYVSGGGQNRDENVCTFTQPHDLRNKASICLDGAGTGYEALGEHVDNIFEYSIKSSHPRFFNQMGMGGTEPIGVLGDAVAAACNHSMYTYEMAPVTTLMEKEVIDQCGKLAGWEQVDGMFNPGGSISNMHAMLLARQWKSAAVKTQGLFNGPKMLAYTSAESHYCFERAGLVLGLGTENVVKVPVDKNGVMIVSELERLLTEATARGDIPFFVNATAGSTVYGAIDDIPAVLAMADKFGAWGHVDGAWGSSALLSDKHRGLLKGVEKAKSLCWNFHKLSGLPQSCSVLLTQDMNIMKDTLKLGGDCSYLYHEQMYDTSIDTGMKSIQCGRRPDAIKVWLLWKSIGLQGMADRIDRCLENRDSFIEMVKARDNFEMVCEPGFNNVCYWYKPKANMTDEEVHKVTADIKQRMMARGVCLVNYQPRQGLPNFWRMVFTNPNADLTDLKCVLDETEAAYADSA